MKNVKLSLVVSLVCGLFFMSSCSKKGEDCHECHIAFENENGSETMWHIESPSGDEEFCGQDLEDAESSSYVYTVTDTLYCEEMGCLLYPGEYGPGSTDSLGALHEIHCEEHAGH